MMVFQQSYAITPYDFGRQLIKECHLVLTKRGSAPSPPAWSTERLNCLRTYVDNVLCSLPAKTLVEYAACSTDLDRLLELPPGYGNLRDSIRKNLAEVLISGFSYEVEYLGPPDLGHGRAPLVTPNSVSFSPNTAPIIRVCTADQVVEVSIVAYLTTISFHMGDLVLVGEVVEPPAANTNLADFVYAGDVTYLRVYSMIGRPYLFDAGGVLDRYRHNNVISMYAAEHPDNTLVLGSRE